VSSTIGFAISVRCRTHPDRGGDLRGYQGRRRASLGVWATSRIRRSWGPPGQRGRDSPPRWPRPPRSWMEQYRW